MAHLRQCLIVPLTLSLLAPLAAEASEPLNRLNRWMNLTPEDWTYQALAQLNQLHSCRSDQPDGMDRSQAAMTRIEAADLLQACLNKVSVTTDAIRRLLREFEAELAILKGRSDAVEARLGELDATSFSTTTKLSGLATFVLGANRFMGSADALVSQNNQRFGATSFNNDLQLSLETSFTGKDLLSTVLRAGNFDGDGNVFGGAGPSSFATLETAFQEGDAPNLLAIDKTFYSFPIGDAFTITAGPRVGQEDMLALWPSLYPTDAILDVLTLNGAPGAYNKTLGAGAGISWIPGDNLSLSLNYVAANGNSSSPLAGGIATAHADSAATLQVGYEQESWRLAVIYSALMSGDEQLAPDFTHAFGIGGSWQPEQSGWLPSISGGWGYTRHDSDSQSWSLGLEWSDVLIDGNSLGMGVGQPVITSTIDDGLVWEWWTSLPISDSISVTPALFLLTRPLGEATPSQRTVQQLGALVKTTFRF